MQQKEIIMQKYFKTILKSPLFYNVNFSDLEGMLICLNAKVKQYNKDSMIIIQGDKISEIGIILAGKVQIIKNDFLGNKNIITELSESDIFGETIVSAKIEKSPVTVETVTGCEIMFIDYRKIITTCSSSCVFHTMLIENMIKVLAEKNIMLNQKIDILSKRNIREKLMQYFSFQAEMKNSAEFDIPFSKSELADFLCVDRSAMSRELSKMCNDKLISYSKKHFKLLVEHQIHD